MKKTVSYALALVALVFLLGASMVFFGTRPPVHATNTCKSGETACLAGWAWSSGAGWISFNSNDAGAGGGPYDVAIDTNGNLTGYAWSSNIGWISFNIADLASSPACVGVTGVTVNTVSGAVNGWVRAVAGIGRNDGWDGCIELSNPSTHASPDSSGYNGTSTQGVTYSPTLQMFTGFAWGGNVVGWLQFSPVFGTGNPITCQPNCGVTVNDLILQAQDTGAGSHGTGVWGNSVSFTIPSAGGSVTVPLKWTIGSATSIKIASTTAAIGVSTDWGVNSGSVQSASGKSVTADNTDSITFTNSGSTSIKKVLILSYKLSGSPTSQTLNITINPYQAPAITCSLPNHALFCTNTDQTQGPVHPEASVNSCQSVSSPLTCEYYCDASNGYKLKGNICVKSAIQEI